MSKEVSFNNRDRFIQLGIAIAALRKLRGFSQEKLAEYADISTVHMSHIETANTKLSLPVFVEIANALEVQLDDLLSETLSERKSSLDELMELLEGCSAQQIRVITDVAKATKISLEKYMDH